MKILLTGSNGQLGFELRRSLAPLGTVQAIGSVDCDLGDEPALRSLIRAFRPTVVVNPAAYTAVDAAEGDILRATAVNARAPGILAEEAERLGAKLIQFSTDYVFDGRKTAPYVETDTPSPLNVYGQTKWAGEKAVQEACSRHLILRTSWLLGAQGKNFARTLLRLAAERDELAVVADQQGAPTSAALLADVTAELLRQDLGGLYHATAGGETTWHAYACHIVERARNAGRPVRVARDAILAISTAEFPTPARRPANSCLNTRSLRRASGLELPPWQVGVDSVLDQLFETTK